MADNGEILQAFLARHPDFEIFEFILPDVCGGLRGKWLTGDKIHKAMAGHGVRLGQPVRCVRLPDGAWGATLRIGLSMPQVVRLDGVGDAELGEWMSRPDRSSL